MNTQRKEPVLLGTSAYKSMKKLTILLLLLVGAFTLVPSQAEARDRRHYRNYDHCDYGYSYRRPVYRTYYQRPVYYSTPRYYVPQYYDCRPEPVCYSRPRSSFSFTIAR